MPLITYDKVMPHMKKITLLLLTATIVLSCGTNKQKTYPDYVLGTKDKKQKIIYSRDSLNIVTPSIEIYNRIKNTSHRKYDDREIVKSFVIEILKSELNKSEHYELKLMSKDYLTVNKVLEEILYQKYKNPQWIVKAPEEILISEKKYTLLITMTARYGEINNGVIKFCVINNVAKTIESIDRYEFNASPLDNNKMKQIIQKGMSKITIM